MSDMKRKLDQMMGDTTEQERRIKRGVHEKLQTPVRKTSWPVLFVSAAIPAIALFLFFSLNPLNQLSSDEGPGMPYDPLDDLAQISALQKKKQLSDVDYETFSSLPHYDQVDGLYYVDYERFAMKGSSYAFHTVIERKTDLYDNVVYKAGDVVRTMTSTTSHLPTYSDAYYEVLAVPGDRVVLKDGRLRINGKEVDSELMKQYEAESVTIAGGYDQLLNAREYFLLNHFPANNTVQGATITPVHKIYGQVVGTATEEQSDSMYLDYLTNRMETEYTPAQTFDLYMYDKLFGSNKLPQTPEFSQISRLGELFLEASYRQVLPITDEQVEVRYEYGREGVAEQVFQMGWDPSVGRWLVED